MFCCPNKFPPVVDWEPNIEPVVFGWAPTKLKIKFKKNYLKNQKIVVVVESQNHQKTVRALDQKDFQLVVVVVVVEHQIRQMKR